MEHSLEPFGAKVSNLCRVGKPDQSETSARLAKRNFLARHAFSTDISSSMYGLFQEARQTNRLAIREGVMTRTSLQRTVPGLIAGLSFLCGPAVAQNQHADTPGAVVAMPALECVSYYTALGNLAGPHENQTRDTLHSRATEIIRNNTPAEQSQAQLEKADKARADAEIILAQVNAGKRTRAQLADAVAACDQSFGFDPLPLVHDQDDPADGDDTDPSIVGNN
tara:strand:- start:9077 stop:9745 length:669 start_codon:yes stop_codon:yes gene_type:complete